MNWIVCDTKEEVYQKVGGYYKAFIRANPRCVLGLATGSTPEGIYAYLAEQGQRGEVDFSQVTTFNLDEYVPMEETHPQSYRSYMNKHLFHKVNISMANTHMPQPNHHPAAYDQRIADCGGIDLQLLGVGHNGHIGFNEPADRLISHTHITRLAKATVQANGRFFAQDEVQPTKAITMGMATILKAKEIICVILGAQKHWVVEQLQHEEIDCGCPATFLKLHPKGTIYCDREAYEG